MGSSTKDSKSTQNSKSNYGTSLVINVSVLVCKENYPEEVSVLRGDPDLLIRIQRRPLALPGGHWWRLLY
jgi:hypothetical protein